MCTGESNLALLRNRGLLAAALGHFLQDTWLGVVPVLMAASSSRMGLTNSQMALGYLFYESTAGLSQPLFGHLTERFGSRTMGVGGVMWTSVMVGLAGRAPNLPVLILLLALGGLGAGAFHPQGAANATLAGGVNRQATSASIFFLGGTLGQAVFGAAVAGLVINALGTQGIILISALVWVLAWTLVRPSVPTEAPRSLRSENSGSVSPSKAAVSGLGLVLLFVVVATRAGSRASFLNFVPKMWEDMGRTPAEYGLALSLFLGGSAIGGVAGSYLADKVGRKRVLLISVLLSMPTMLWFLWADGIWAYVAMVAAGVGVGPAHTLLVVTVQDLLPTKAAFASGVALGVTFLSASGCVWLAGLAADAWGVRETLVGSALILVLTVASILIAIPSDRRSRSQSGITAEAEA